MKIPPLRLLHDTLLESASASPSRVAIIDEGASHTYSELLEASGRLARALRAEGVRRGDRVAIHLDNGFTTAVGIYGALMADAAFSVINPQTKRDKLAFILDDAEAVCLIAHGHLAREWEPIIGDRRHLRAVFVDGELPPRIDASKVRSLPSSIASGEPGPPPSATIPLDLASLIYTSGSTGDPKGVMMTHQSMLFTVGSLLEYLRLDHTHRILDVLPLAFDYGLYQLLMSVAAGATLVLEKSFTYPARVLERMAQHEVTVFPGVPTIYALLLQMHGREPLSFPSVRRVTNTAAALPASTLPGLKEIFPNALIFKMYGLTECKRVAYLEPEELPRRPGSVGRAIPGTEVFLRSPEGAPVPPGERGILHVRGPHVMLGYWNRPESTAQMLVSGPYPSERVLCTRDWFRMDEDGYLYFIGRSDDIIKTRGEKVSPVEVENVLYGLRGVVEAAVIGVTDPLLGQAIRAYVVVDPSSGVDERAIKRWCAAHLESFMVPHEIRFRDSLPKTSSGKIRKTGLDDQPLES